MELDAEMLETYMVNDLLAYKWLYFLTARVEEPIYQPRKFGLQVPYINHAHAYPDNSYWNSLFDSDRGPR